MWILTKVQAKNLCAFKEMEFSPAQQHTTLIFGNNMDDDSQQSNGSGKSALLEAIAIAITGETMRDAKMDEIINDAEDSAYIEVMLWNDELHRSLEIRRNLYRKKPQEVAVYVYIGEAEQQPIVMPSVAEYNKYILDQLGLTRDDIYANFILTEGKYSSFLSASDRVKKEIINRFSNGIMVDESIAALETDMQPIEEELKKAETEVATCTGRVEALQEQINTTINEVNERSQKKAERIAGWKEKIASLRASIREHQKSIDDANDALDKQEIVDKKREALEEGKKDVISCSNELLPMLKEVGIVIDTDYVSGVEQSKLKLGKLNDDMKVLEKQMKDVDKRLQAAKTSQQKLVEKYQTFASSFDTKYQKVTEKINKLLSDVRSLENDNQGLKTQRTNLEKDIAELQKQLAGVIVCPKCKHEFTLAGDIDITETRQKMQDRQGEVDDILQTIEKNEKDISSLTDEGKKTRKKQNELNDSKADWSKKITDASVVVNGVQRELNEISHKIDSLHHDINTVTASISNARNSFFDDVYDAIDQAYKTQDNIIKQAELDIKNAEGAIQSYEESINEINNSSETDVIQTLKNSKAKYEKDLDKAISNKQKVEQKLNSYKAQEATFVEFKTHLANTKIDALSHITNEFLEAIGSNIRIAFSGYTVLKSGKVRDKISISLIRDGVDCGSFGKFSKGERTRVNLANILALHKLTNLNCESSKGLNLLVLDEILDGTDERGLTNIFEALNQLQITALVVTHTNIAENYPYKVVVTKHNGVSHIDA